MADDLAEGLGLMLRAARKAVREIEPDKLEQLGKKAKEKLESIDAKQVAKQGIDAVRHLDPKKIERFAEEAGKEVLNAVERVAARVENAVSGKSAGGSAASEPAPPAGDAPEADAAHPRVRVEQPPKG